MKVIKLTNINFVEVALTAAGAIESGELIVYPTDTVYGLGVDVKNDKAVEKLWKFKGERGDKPVLLAVNGEKMAEKYIEINDLGKKLIRKYWPGSVSIVGVSKNKVAKKIQGEKDTLGLRMIENKFVMEMIHVLGKPITSTSANVTGGKTCASVEEFLREIPEEKRELVGLFVDAGTLEGTLPSTIVDISKNKIEIVRQGEVKVSV